MGLAGGLTPPTIPSQDAEGSSVEVSVKDNGNGIYSCSYVPKKPVKHTAMVSWGGVNIPSSPFRVSCLHPQCTQVRRSYLPPKCPGVAVLPPFIVT